MSSDATDVLIIGAGIAGISCALDLLDQGKRVTIVDRDRAEALGGLAKWSFGGMFFVGTKQQRKSGFSDSTALAKEDWWSCAEFDEDEIWGPKWAEQYIHLCTPHAHDWLCSHGAKFFPVVNWTERGMERQGNSVPRFHIIWGTGWGLTELLVHRLQHHPKRKNLTLLFEHRVIDLDVQDGNVTGASGKFETSGQEFNLRAEIVVVATGGINGSIERVRTNWSKSLGGPPKTILNGAHPFAVGDMHDAVKQVGGEVTHLDRQWNYAAGIRHYAPRHEDHGLSLVPGKSQVWVNYKGERFGPRPLMSPYDTRYLVEQICAEKEKYSWQILNRKIALKEFAISGSEHNPAIRDKKLMPFLWQTLVTGDKKLVDKIGVECEDFIVAPTLEKLVKQMNALSGSQHIVLGDLEKVLEEFDREIAKGATSQDEQVQRIIKLREYRGDRVRTSNLQSILDPKAGPLIAIRSFILSRKTLGGIQTDLRGRVLSQANEQGKQHSLPNLYAIGEAAGFGGGGMHGRGSLEGTFLGGCIITGRVCAAAIGDQVLE